MSYCEFCEKDVPVIINLPLREKPQSIMLCMRCYLHLLKHFKKVILEDWKYGKATKNA